ncbi:GPW/gp25 family protein [Paenibacillus sp. SAF-054]|uniref:GPW/gp25 family protein n=1 Tax=unclassified Paenibacillus TaxID=185978 RepID=UPI003F7F8FCB
MTTTYTVTTDSPEIKLGLTGVESVKQNIRLICTTVVGSCPLDRAFGVDPVLIDQALPAAGALLQVNIQAAIEEFEPRAAVTDIQLDWQGTKLVPTIKFIMIEEASG